nr:reverse transcriptase domain-containing protein [Tanacetum cinerariifolium]
MSTTNQWMNFTEIKRLVAHRVANAIETIAIYEIKTCMARDSMDRVERLEDKEAKNASNKRKWEGDHDGSSSQNKRHKVSRAHAVRPNNKKIYARKLPHYNRCKYHHTEPFTAKCGNYKRIGHQTKDCRSLAAATNQRATVANQRTFTFFECGKQRHYCSECPNLKTRTRRTSVTS